MIKKLALVLLMGAVLTVPAAGQGLADATITNIDATCKTSQSCVLINPANSISVGVFADIGTSAILNFEFSLDATNIVDGNWLPLNDDVSGTTTLIAEGVKFFTNFGYKFIRIRPTELTGSTRVFAFRGYARNGVSASGSTVISGEVSILNLEPSSDPAFSVSSCPIFSAATNNSTNCSTSATNLFGIWAENTNETVYYLRLYNSATAPSGCPSTNAVRPPIAIPPGVATGKVGGIVINKINPRHFTNGLSYCITAGSADDNNASAVTGIFGELIYKAAN